MNSKNWASKRMSLPNECILVHQFGLVEAQIDDISLMKLGVKTDNILPFSLKNGCKLDVFISGVEFPQAELLWAERGINNMTKLRLKFSTSIIN